MSDEGEGRRWSLEAARVMLPDVIARTGEAVEVVDALMERRDTLDDDSPALAQIEEEIEACFSRWVREMEALGAEVKGPWLVDFDSGAGYFCWRWPEQELLYFHGYDDGFSGRTRIQ